MNLGDFVKAAKEAVNNSRIVGTVVEQADKVGLKRLEKVLTAGKKPTEVRAALPGDKKDKVSTKLSSTLKKELEEKAAAATNGLHASAFAEAMGARLLPSRGHEFEPHRPSIVREDDLAAEKKHFQICISMTPGGTGTLSSKGVVFGVVSTFLQALRGTVDGISEQCSHFDIAINVPGVVINAIPASEFDPRKERAGRASYQVPENRREPAADVKPPERIWEPKAKLVRHQLKSLDFLVERLGHPTKPRPTRQQILGQEYCRFVGSKSQKTVVLRTLVPVEVSTETPPGISSSGTSREEHKPRAALLFDPPGAGKTAVVLGYIGWMVEAFVSDAKKGRVGEDGGPVLVVVPTQFLADQWAREVKKFLSGGALKYLRVKVGKHAEAALDELNKENQKKNRGASASTGRVPGMDMIIVTKANCDSKKYGGAFSNTTFSLAVFDEVDESLPADHVEINARRKLGLLGTKNMTYAKIVEVGRKMDTNHRCMRLGREHENTCESWEKKLSWVVVGREHVEVWGENVVVGRETAGRGRDSTRRIEVGWDLSCGC